MAPLGRTSLARLDGVKNITLSRAQSLANLLTEHGGDLGIAAYGGLRNDATQAQLVKWRDDSVAAGGAWYRVSPVGKSNHRTGDAFDIRVNVPAKGMTVEQTYAFLAQVAPSLGLRSGASYGDPYHFENKEASPHGPSLVETVTDAAQRAGFTPVEVLISVLAFGLLLFLLLR